VTYWGVNPYARGMDQGLADWCRDCDAELVVHSAAALHLNRHAPC
jgi:hypothetical protein